MIDDMVFTSDWVTSHAAKWTELLGHLRDAPARGLEIGVFEGRSSQWWLKNILTHPQSRLVAIDPWREKSAANRDFLRADPTHGHRYEYHGWPAQLIMARELSHSAGVYDFVYLDGGKEAARVMEQSVLAWMLLKPGGVLIWDDYAWTWEASTGGPKPVLPPAAAIDAFLSAYAPELEVIGQGWQVAVRKIDTSAAL